MTAWGNTTDRILLLLQDRELTKVEICKALELDHDAVSSVLTRLKRPSKRFGKRIYICDYVRAVNGQKHHIRPVFTAGKKLDARRPEAFSAKVRSLTYYYRMVAKRRNNSIFNMALTNREIFKEAA